jgi:hypothetical protein
LPAGTQLMQAAIRGDQHASVSQLPSASNNPLPNASKLSRHTMKFTKTSVAALQLPIDEKDRQAED